MCLARHTTSTEHWIRILPRRAPLHRVLSQSSMRTMLRRSIAPHLRAASRCMSSSPRGEAEGAPLLHAFNKAYPRSPPKVHVRGEGDIYVVEKDGTRLLDGLAGLWSVNLGYNQPRLVAAATQQMSSLPYYHNFWNQGHDRAYELAGRLADFIPFPIEKVAFTSGGSDANDTAVKIAWYYNNSLGRASRKKIIARTKGYHGVTAVAASLSGLPGLHKTFGAAGQDDLPLPGFLHVTCPHLYRSGAIGESEEEFAKRCAAELEATILREGPETIAAFIAEPLMGAGGVMPPPRSYFKEVQKILKRHDVLLIADEVVTGFGRLGYDVGSQAYGLEPDMMCFAKAITSSYVPMGAVAISKKVADVIADGSEGGLFGHGYTFGGHPVACAVAVECLDIYKEQGILSNTRARSDQLLGGLKEVAKGSGICGELRGKGLIVAAELVADRGTRVPFPAAAGVGAKMCAEARKGGLIVRAIGDTIAMSPPLVITKEGVDEIVGIFDKALKKTEEWAVKEGHLKGGTEGELFTTSLQIDGW